MEVKIFQHFHVCALDLTLVLESTFAPERAGGREKMKMELVSKYMSSAKWFWFFLHVVSALSAHWWKMKNLHSVAGYSAIPQFLMYSSNFLTLRKLCFPYKALWNSPLGLYCLQWWKDRQRKGTSNGTRMMRINIKGVCKGYLLLNEYIMCYCAYVMRSRFSLVPEINMRY